MRQIRMLRAMRRELETALRILLTGHEGGNPGYSQGESYGLPRQLSTRLGHEYVDKGLQYYEERHRLQQIHSVTKRAAKLGLLIVDPHPA